MTLTKAELADLLFEKVGLNKREAKDMVEAFFEEIRGALERVKRRGNRRYYQHHEVLLIRRIRELLYEEGFTISGARNRLDNARLDNARLDSPLGAEEKIEALMRNNGRATTPPPGVDVAA